MSSSVPPMLRTSTDLLRHRDLRLFFAAWAASSIGAGAGYVALLFAVEQQFGAGYALGAVMLAQFAPAMLFGLALGAQVDRRSRRRCALVADALGAVALAALAFAGPLPLVIVLAAVAGIGQAVGGPAHMALLPRLAGDDRLAPATTLYGVIDEAGYLAGPLLAAGVLVLAGPEVLLLANAATFLVSGVVLARLPHDAPVPATAGADGLVEKPSSREALRLLRTLPAAGIVLAASSAAVLSVALTNVGKVGFTTGDLGGGGSSLGLIIALMAAGTLVGSVSSATTDRTFRLRYVAGLLAMGTGLLVAVGTPFLPLVLAGLLVCGWGNGAALTHERLILQHEVPDDAKGRIFGLRKSLVAWAFCGGYAITGPLAAAGGGRLLLLVASAAALVAAAYAGRRLLAGQGAGIQPYIRGRLGFAVRIDQ